jgi:hypothetical protein
VVDIISHRVYDPNINQGEYPMGAYAISALDLEWAETVAGHRLTIPEARNIVMEYNDYLDKQEYDMAEMELVKHVYDF